MAKVNPDIIRKYTSVAASTTVTEDYVVPNGKTLIVTDIYLDGCGEFTSISAIWDPDGSDTIIAYTARDAHHQMRCEFVGDGSKKIRIKLKNSDTVNARTCGGVIQGIEY